MAALEGACFAGAGHDPWTASMFLAELDPAVPAARSWWVAHDDGELIGFAGGMVVDGGVEILDVAVAPAHRREGIARKLLAHVSYDAQMLGCTSASLEVEDGNEGAIALYASLGFSESGRRRGYYGAGLDALVMTAPLPLVLPVDSAYGNEGAIALYASLGFSESGRRRGYYGAGLDALVMTAPLPLVLPVDSASPEPTAAAAREWPLPTPERTAEEAAEVERRRLVLAIESSCDETAVAIVDADGELVANQVSTQIDFHARFGGVVPEIASRKHVEVIVGVVDAALEEAARTLGLAGGAISPTELAAVGVTQGPGLVGALVVGVAFAKGFAYAAGKPLVCVNHLEGISPTELAAVGVTQGPGLVGALVVGVAFAKGFAYAAGKPLVCVNHLEGHLYANKLTTPDLEPPFIFTLVSGGHTMLVHVRAWGDYEVLGETLDDAVGEAFDKVAKALGLGYPGGPIISRLAETGDPKAWGDYEVLGETLDDAVGEAFDKVAKALGLGYPGGPIISRLAETGDPKAIDFPRALNSKGDYRFSLSGLKTAVTLHIEQETAAGRTIDLHDLAASFEAAVFDVQYKKAKCALRETGAREYCIGGGVAANPHLRNMMVEKLGRQGVRVTVPPKHACTDNAAMIAVVAREKFLRGEFSPFERNMMVEKLGRQGVRVTVPPKHACTDNAAMIAVVAREKFLRGEFSPFDVDADPNMTLCWGVRVSV